MWCRWLCRSRSHGRGWRGSFAARRITNCCGCYYDLHRRDFNCRLCDFGISRNRNLVLNPRFDQRGWFLGRCGWRCGCGRRRCRCFLRNGDGGRRTRHRLRCDESRCRLRRLHRSNRRSTSCNHRRLGHAARRTCRHGRRRCHGLAWRRCRSCSSRGTRSYLRLGGLLRDRLQHVSRFGDVREVNLGLELFRLGARAAAAGAAAGLSVLSVILLDALRLIHFDGAGVRFLFRDPDLDQQIEDHLAFDLEFPRQVVNSNLLQHSALFPPYCPVRSRVHSILTL